MKKYYYAKRVYAVNAGRSGKDYFAFSSRRLRDRWIDKEKHTAPCGCGGGERLELKASQLSESIKKEAHEQLLYAVSVGINDEWQSVGV